MNILLLFLVHQWVTQILQTTSTGLKQTCMEPHLVIPLLHAMVSQLDCLPTTLDLTPFWNKDM